MSDVNTGQLLADALYRSTNFDWDSHMKWLWNKSVAIKAMNRRYPINLVYRVADNSKIFSGCIVYIDGYTGTRVGVCPLGTSDVKAIDPVYLENITDKVRRGEITEDDVVRSIAKAQNQTSTIPSSS